jgi:antitoxin component of MazEF toxin-antitoxin module
MKTRVVRCGNSRGIRIPKLLLAQTGLPDEVEISAEGNSIVFSANPSKLGLTHRWHRLREASGLTARLATRMFNNR